jgi:hypothetical protein
MVTQTRTGPRRQTWCSTTRLETIDMEQEQVQDIAEDNAEVMTPDPLEPETDQRGELVAIAQAMLALFDYWEAEDRANGHDYVIITQCHRPIERTSSEIWGIPDRFVIGLVFGGLLWVIITALVLVLT